MNKLTKLVSDFMREEEGLTIVEYAIAGAMISAAIAGAFATLGSNIGDAIEALGTTVSEGGGSGT